MAAPKVSFVSYWYYVHLEEEVNASLDYLLVFPRLGFPRLAVFLKFGVDVPASFASLFHVGFVRNRVPVKPFDELGEGFALERVGETHYVANPRKTRKVLARKSRVILWRTLRPLRFLQ